MHSSGGDLHLELPPQDSGQPDTQVHYYLFSTSNSSIYNFVLLTLNSNQFGTTKMVIMLVFFVKAGQPFMLRISRDKGWET